ncbi:methionyl-tRNA formyltransferase [Coprococcus sp. NSJ-10]|jgi:methionyl-tRNA formyltransferase|uniref:Methionyl-tRNA formyltransferase n=1 Tax=Coprococcus hominis (ex Liu et al. 2022) TaxID=2763039 RepID=A0A8I0APN8_9FIRM|nr:methionyl-tRNA formyltransferase [Coprococcus hominis (ex Liu et al. 2022)]MBC5662688.1 methionyl-tRNA formyltransferase [Coprococcus hominis (ex Liu et al. 2022)]
MNIIYMGTPEFAVKPLQAIVDAGHKVLACFTQPDKPKGRGKTLQPTPVKKKALSLDIPVYQPVKLREEENVQIIRDYQPDAIVVAAYGQILPESILNIPQYGCINIHASLLPKYRGAAPIEWTIINGETESGVTTMYMAKGLDTGDMIEKTVVPIADTDTGVTLHDKLADAGAELILSTLSKLENHTAIRTPQDDSLSCYASMLKKEMGELDFTKDAASLERLIRGLQPWPVAYTKMNRKTVRIYEASVCEQPEEALEDGTQIVPGMIVRVTKKNFTVACGNGALMIRKLQPEGKKPMDCAAFLAGNKLKTGQMIYE